jgi:hypothetical protein
MQMKYQNAITNMYVISIGDRGVGVMEEKKDMGLSAGAGVAEQASMSS